MEQSTIRTFRGANAREALAAAREALGPDAVVLHTREVPPGIFRAPMFEVVAALDDARTAAASRPPARAPERPPPPPRWSDPLPELKPRPIEVAGLPPPDFSHEIGQLRSALDEARQLIGTLSSARRGGGPLAGAAEDVHAALVTRGMDPSDATDLLEELLARGTPVRQLALFSAVRDRLQGRLQADRAPWLRTGRTAIAFVGPTGVGKTTTLAKVAARALMERGRRVGLITVDTYRIGASEQLARYGEIMGVPALVAKDRASLAQALDRLNRCDLVLIDTAGRSQADQVQRQAELVRTVPGVELHLVVSAATGSREMKAVADRYGNLRPERLILSKLDEAVAPAGFLSVTGAIAAPVSCICDGQRVPEDIHAVTRSDLVDLVLGSWDHGE